MPPKKTMKSIRQSRTSRRSVQPGPISEEDFYGTIEINILTLESSFETGIFTLTIVYGNNFVGKINKINIPIGGGKANLNRKFFLYIKSMDNYVMDAMLSTPFFFSMIEGENRVDPKLFAVYGVAAAVQTNVVGQGNLGIMPLLTGQPEMESVVVLEPPGTQETIFFRRKYSEHPRLYVKLTDTRKNLSAKKLNNIMWLSVESVYNLDHSYLLEDADHTLVFPLPSVSLDEEMATLEEMFAVGEEPFEEVREERKKSIGTKKGKQKGKPQKPPQSRASSDSDLPEIVEIKKPVDMDLIQFDRGIYKWEQTIDIRKKWASLASINGAPAMTEQRIKTDCTDLLSTIPLDLRRKFRNKIEPRIEWNMVRPIWLHSDLEMLVKERIIQYGVWPFELLMLGKLFADPQQLLGRLRAKFDEDNEDLAKLKLDIENIFSSFHELMEILNTDSPQIMDQVEVAKRLTELEARMTELLARYEVKTKENLVAHMPYIEKMREEGKSSSYIDESPVSLEESDSDPPDIPKEVLNQDDIVILERKAYIAWVDLSPLLVPGCTHLRTAGVLQHFNREEAVAKWGLTTTYSGDPQDIDPRDEDLTVMLAKDPVDINKIYSDLKKSDLVKCSTNLLLLLGRLLELSYNIKKMESEPNQPSDLISEKPPSDMAQNEEKKRTKLKFQEEDKKKGKAGQRFKIEADGHLKKSKDTGNSTRKTGQLGTDSTRITFTNLNKDDEYDDDYWLKMNAFDVSEIGPLSSGKKNKTKHTSGLSMRKSTVSSTSTEDRDIGEEETLLKTEKKGHYFQNSRTHSQELFTVYNTHREAAGEANKSPQEEPPSLKQSAPIESGQSIATESMSPLKSSSTVSSRSHEKKFPLMSSDVKLKANSKIEGQFSSESTIDEEEESEKSISSNSKSSSELNSLSISIDSEESLLELLKSLLGSIIERYENLKGKYEVLKTMKTKEEVCSDDSEQETTSSTSGSEYGEETDSEWSSSNDEMGIKKVEPRHKMWHVGQNLSDKVMENQIHFTNNYRKMAVLEREFLLLKRLRLAQMKSAWVEKLRDITPQYLENSKGDKVVVIIDIKLLKPLVPKPTLTEIDLDIQELMKNSNFKKKPVSHVNDCFDEFHQCIITLTNLITSEYQDYKKSYGTIIDPLSGETGNEFYDYLEKSRAHQIITESLSEGMKGYLATALRDSIPTSEKNDQKNLRFYVGWLYSRMVDEMQSVVNKIIIDGDNSLPETNIGDLPNISCSELYLFAVEAIEEMDYDRAKYYLSKRLEGNKRNEPAYWIDYAVIALRIGDYQQAIECVKEALVLDSRNKEGLILYAVMLMMEGRFEDAQLFFNALINFYPMFVEGWMAFHMFYLIVENKIGADITLVAGTKISHDYELPCPTKPPQLSWDNRKWIGNEPGNYISTAIYFLSFNMYEFAEVCLAQELERVGAKSIVWVYYLSVCHYIQGRYEDSAKHLSKAIAEVHNYNMDPRIWILLGHNCWMMGLKRCALEMYLQAFTQKQNELHEHMTFIRCGFFFLEKEQSRFAKQMFLRAVKQQGTPMGWLGLGIALFMEGKLDDAELALKEANMLDTTMGTAWGYLALISLYKLKEDQFLHCFREAKRYGLDDKKLAFEIEMISQEIASYSKSKDSQNCPSP